MARRSPETLADYLVVAISPALIMLLVGSLVFFLIEVFYQGQYETRLLFVMAMFVMAIVCVARISMEEGAGYAALFGAPLAIVTAIALARFVRVEGPLAAFGQLINWGLMALIWWSAHKLTWDCTLIDDSQDASGHGLLQELGFDRSAATAGTAPAGPAGTSAPAAPEATSGETVAPLPWWQRIFEADRRPHAPGLWVVYFSIAALPLFGIGGWFIPAEAAVVRQRAFLFLVVYVGTGLTLLLATSFLGLRRYLRQRRLEMPVEMAAGWVGVGVVLIVATLLICALLPRPDSLRSLAKLPIEFTSPDHQANRVAVGPEGAKDDPQRPSSSTADAQKEQESQREGKGAPQPGQGGREQKQSSSGEQSQQEDKSGADSQQSSNKNSETKGNGNSSKSAGEQQPDGGDRSGDDNGAAKPDGQKKAEQGKAEARGKKTKSSSNSDQADDDNSNNPNQQSSDSQRSTPPPARAADPPPPSRSFPSVRIAWGESLGWMLRLLFYLALAIVVVVVAYVYREQLVAAWRKLLQELRELFSRWFGGRAKVADAAALAIAPAPPRPFADFTDPFASGAAGRMSWADLVRYTYQALEAWGRESGCPRGAGQTPHEFAAALAQSHPALGRLAATLADWYGQLAYASRPAPSGATDPLRQLWQGMRSGQTLG